MSPDILHRMEMVGLKAGLRIDRFDRFGEALGVIREGRGHLETEVFELLQKLSGIVPILRRPFMGHQDAVVLILHYHHTTVRPQRIVAINVTLRRRGEGKQVPQHLLWRGQMRANGINPTLERPPAYTLFPYPTTSQVASPSKRTRRIRMAGSHHPSALCSVTRGEWQERCLGCACCAVVECTVRE